MSETPDYVVQLYTLERITLDSIESLQVASKDGYLRRFVPVNVCHKRTDDVSETQSYEKRARRIRDKRLDGRADPPMILAYRELESIAAEADAALAAAHARIAELEKELAWSTTLLGQVRDVTHAEKIARQIAANQAILAASAAQQAKEGEDE